MSNLEHPHIVAGPLHTARNGECVWLYHAFGVWLHCDEKAVPGKPQLCADHLIEWAAEREASRETVRRFPSTIVTRPEATA